MSLKTDLEAAKIKAGERQFDVTITELLKRTVQIVAKDKFEAEQMVSDFWRDSMYVLNWEDFHSVDFEAIPTKRERSLEVKGKELYTR
jgi:hypothetical protein